MTTTTPVLFLIFNRLDTTALVMKAIRAAQPMRLYVAADGPRDRPGEAERCEMVRKLATAVDWPCQVHTLFRDQNLGCRRAVSSAIDWFFDHEEEGIILEDDCLPSTDFFRFCGELLPRFRMEKRVMAICGSCYTESTFDMSESYYFSYYADMWGWATWKRAWQLYDRDLSRWSAFKQAGSLEPVLGRPPWLAAAWARLFDQTADGEIESWAYPWIYTVFEQGGLACYPTRNLVSNLGWGEDAVNTKVPVGANAGLLACRPHQPFRFPLRHPCELARSEALEGEQEGLRLFFMTNPERGYVRKFVKAGLMKIFLLLPTTLREHIKSVRARLRGQTVHGISSSRTDTFPNG